ncbi:MAG: Mobile element protein, partial [uncultured Chloroflexia bacterium]
RALEGTPKTVYLVKRADNHWYALIVCAVPEATPSTDAPSDTRPAAGLDVGLRSFLTDSEGTKIENPRHFRATQHVLRRKQRTLARRTKGSHRRSKAARSVAQTHLKIERQRRDFHFKVAHRYAMLYALLVVEALNIQGMVRNRHLSKSIHDAGWAAFLSILTYKAERAGSAVVRVPAAYTTQRCSRCGDLTPKSLSVRTHVCQHCSFVMDRDQNAAVNILRAGARPSSDDVHKHVG